MSDWRNRLSMNAEEIREMSAEGMAATRIMKSLGSSVREIGSACRRFGIPYNESDTTFQRSVNIFREVYDLSRLVEVFDVHSVRKLDDIMEDIMADGRPAIIFVRTNRTKDSEATMTAYVRCQGLCTSPLGQIVIRPGIRYVANRGCVELWEQEPITLLKSFKKE